VQGAVRVRVSSARPVRVAPGKPVFFLFHFLYTTYLHILVPLEIFSYPTGIIYWNHQCSRSVTFWYRSGFGSVPVTRVSDPDPDPHGSALI
jgi:hypothetical protein